MDSKDFNFFLEGAKFPRESSLGLLAYGDVAFLEWRRIKKNESKDIINEEE